MKKTATIVFSIERSFVKSDILIFEALGFKVLKIKSEPHKTITLFILNRFKEAFKSIIYLPKSDFVVSWFNDYHTFMPILISKLLFKKSIIIVGGYDAIVDQENKHGIFLNNGLRSYVAKVNYKMASEVWVVHKTLENGCRHAEEKFNITSGVRNFVDKKNIIIKEINTGYDSRFWNYDHEKDKSGVLTAAFFSDKRVISIKGLKLFNKLASLVPDVNFTIAGQSEINIEEIINLEPNVNVIGVQSKTQMKELYQKNKFYFQGSRLEGLPNTVCEAMLCGCVPIGSRVFGIPDVIGNAGILFDTEKNLQQVAKYINSDLTKYNSKKARQRIKRKLDVSFRIEKIKERIVQWK